MQKAAINYFNIFRKSLGSFLPLFKHKTSRIFYVDRYILSFTQNIFIQIKREKLSSEREPANLSSFTRKNKCTINVNKEKTKIF